MTAYRAGKPGPRKGFACALLGALALVLSCVAPALAVDKAQVLATAEPGFGRIIINFPERLDLPEYRVRSENGVLAVEFDEPVDALLSDVAVSVPSYVAVARVDPDKRGIRFGLRAGFQVSRLEAGERLFIDLLPPEWQGLPPALPAEVVSELAERGRVASIKAERTRKAELAKALNPVAKLRMGRNPTFIRIMFEWNVDTEGSFKIDGGKGEITFDWPVPVDLFPLKASLPDEITAIDNRVGNFGSVVEMALAKGVTPRFYATGERTFVLDIDVDPATGVAAAIAGQKAEDEKREELAEALEVARSGVEPGDAMSSSASDIAPLTAIVPTVSIVGSTMRVAFPFEKDTPAAVFRRGDTVWMVFDTDLTIQAPAGGQLDAIASNFEVTPAGPTKVVRMDLAVDKLATLGSEGRSWVLSLGDVLLAPTEPVRAVRQRDETGQMRMVADLARPSQVHDFRDPIAGDMLKVVTAFPPARGVLRDLDYVDFNLLRSVHGLVVKPENESIEVSVEGTNVFVDAKGGLSLSALDSPRPLDGGSLPEYRSSYLDLLGMREDDLGIFVERREDLSDKAAQNEGRQRDSARLDLAHYYIANGFAVEAIGVLDLLESNLEAKDLRRKVTLARGIADTLAHRPKDALALLSNEALDDDIDVLMWRTVAKANLGDFSGARADALAAENVLSGYPSWVRMKFLLAASRAAVETRDPVLATRYLDQVEFGVLEREDVTRYQLLQGRVAEIEGRTDEALDAYGQVIAAEVRPTRAEAVYRTLLLLDEAGRIDVAKATETLSAEVLLWRGGALEADMQALLAKLYFDNKKYREGFDTVKQTVAHHPESRVVNALQEQAQDTFNDLYLNGRADELDPVEALGLYYDFRQLTPPGVRGDEMIRNLARRLVKVDLLQQAGDLLEYQIDSRLKGASRSQVAADLAVIRIADRNPEGALRALNLTRLAELPPRIERQRRILEARALIDAGRERLAIDLLKQLSGRDADLLRIEGYWQAKNYVQAGELIEVMYSSGLHPEPLVLEERMNIIRAAVGFVLAGDMLGVNRLRSKFGDEMAKSAQWEMFDFVTRDISPTSIEFRKVAREVSGLDTLNAFLRSYRDTYSPTDQMTPTAAVAAAEV